MKLNYKQKIFLYFFVVFSLFTIGVVVFEQKREKKYKTENFESEQRAYAEFIHRFILHNKIGLNGMDGMKNVLPYLPDNIRITIVNNSGDVLYDNDVDSVEKLENHINRPEIKKAMMKKYGSNVRKSASLNREFLYYAVHYENYYVRVAMPYDIQVKNFLKTDNVFLYFIILLFFAALLAIVYISNRFGTSISRLKDFVIKAREGGGEYLDGISFPDDELGEIGNKIVELYKQIRYNKKKIATEREKLLQHFQSSQEGICFFSPEREKIYANSHFVQYLNILSDKPTLNIAVVFQDPVFKSIQEFLDDNSSNKPVLYATQIGHNGKHFNVRVVCFEDKSFEISINDITKTEKNRLIKQEITSNIAHDLRTPVTSIRGYLETLKNQPDIEADKRQFFVERAYSQIIRLSELIQDISLITRIEEASEMFEIEEIHLLPMLNELGADLSGKLAEHNVGLNVNVSDSVKLEGNRTLLYSIFRNLMDNSIAYAGDNIRIGIDNYMEDDEYYYFSYYDTGSGVDAKHLGRLFERFYRVTEGRTSDTGGSGLGLSIVKNAVLFHKGEIVAKNRKEGGLEFLFTLKKS